MADADRPRAVGPPPDDRRHPGQDRPDRRGASETACACYATIPEKTSDFLRTTVEACLKEIMKTMSGQFITHNTENDQYYLDLDRRRSTTTPKSRTRRTRSPNSHLDQYYFDALTRVLECADQTYVRGYQIWEHEIEWREHKITRRGYLFFGAPNERSTAQPPRDFYLYFLQPFEPPHFEDQKLADEVFFKLAHTDKPFQEPCGCTRGLGRWRSSASSGTKKVYEDKADGFLKTLVAWLRQNMLTSFEVVHQGVPKKMVEWLKGHRTGNAAVRDLVELTGSVCLATSFEDRYPEYPTFTVKLTASNLKQPTEDVIRWLAGGVKNKLATAVLDGLELLDGDKLKPTRIPLRQGRAGEAGGQAARPGRQPQGTRHRQERRGASSASTSWSRNSC